MCEKQRVEVVYHPQHLGRSIFRGIVIKVAIRPMPPIEDGCTRREVIFNIAYVHSDDTRLLGTLRPACHKQKRASDALSSN